MTIIEGSDCIMVYIVKIHIFFKQILQCLYDTFVKSLFRVNSTVNREDEEVKC